MGGSQSVKVEEDNESTVSVSEAFNEINHQQSSIMMIEPNTNRLKNQH